MLLHEVVVDREIRMKGRGHRRHYAGPLHCSSCFIVPWLVHSGMGDSDPLPLLTGGQGIMVAAQMRCTSRRVPPLPDRTRAPDTLPCRIVSVASPRSSSRTPSVSRRSHLHNGTRWSPAV